MDFYSAWPSVVCLAVLVLLASTPLLRALDPPGSANGGRIPQIDGMRGFLALLVFFHHAVIYHSFEMTGGWWLPPLRFYQTLGPLAVSMFFMITGYLFYGKLLAEGGRPRWVRLYVGRVFRIGPLYLLALAILLAGVARARPHLEVPPAMLAREVGTWMLLGFGKQVDVNGFSDTWTLDAGVTWTLRYEWLFYAALLPLSLLVRAGRIATPLLVATLVAVLLWAANTRPSALPPTVPVLLSMFGAGMAAAVWERSRWFVRSSGGFPSLGILACLAGTFGWPGVYGFATTVLLGVAFAVIVGGNDLFGLLACRAARRLGEASFGIYLLQAPALATVFTLAPIPIKRSPAGFWCCVLAAAVLLVGCATVAHVAVERPGIAAGRRLIRLRSRHPRPMLVSRP